MRRIDAGTLVGMGLFLLAIFCFCLRNTLAKSLSGAFSVTGIIFFQNLFALMLLSPMVFKGTWKVKRLDLLLLRGILCILPQVFLFIAMKSISLPDAVTLNSSTPIIIPLLALFFYKERLSLMRWMWILLGYCGVLIVIRPGFQSLEWGMILAMIAAIGNAISFMMVQHLQKEEQPLMIVMFALGTPLVISSFFAHGSFFDLNWSVIAVTFSMGTAALIGQTSMTFAFGKAPLTRLIPLDFMTVIFATLFNWLFFEGAPDLYSLLGGLLILGSGSMISLSRVSVQEEEPQEPAHQEIDSVDSSDV